MNKQASKNKRLDEIIGRFRSEEQRLREAADEKAKLAEAWERLKKCNERREREETAVAA